MGESGGRGRDVDKVEEGAEEAGDAMTDAAEEAGDSIEEGYEEATQQ